MTHASIEAYIESEWNHPNGVYDRVITDVPGCARFVHRILKGGSECSMDNLICYWFRNA